MSDSGYSTFSYGGPVRYGGGHDLVGDEIGFPESIDFFAPRTLQADQDPTTLIPVYRMWGQAGDLVGNVDRHLLPNHHNLKYELMVIAFDGGITGQFYILFKIWSEKRWDGTQGFPQQSSPSVVGE